MNEKIEQQRAHFNSIAERYSKAREGENHLTLKKIVWDEFFSRNQLQFKETPVSVLEPMCGFGDGRTILQERLGHDFEYSGFDYSENVVDEVNRNSPQLNVWFEDATKFRPDQEYDLIILLGGLHHVPEQANTVVENLCGCLKSGGYFINLEPTNGNVLFRLVREGIYKKNTLFDSETERAFEPRSLRDMFESNKMKLLDSVSPGFLTYILYYNPDAFPLLNCGGPRVVSTLYWMESPLLRNWFFSKMSFATLALYQRC